MIGRWFSSVHGKALVSINVVTLRRARFVPGWVTVLGRLNHGEEPGTDRGHLSLGRPSVCRRNVYPAKVGGALPDCITA